MNSRILILLLLLFPASIFGQNNYDSQANYLLAGVYIRTSGWGVGAQYFKNLGGKWDLAMGLSAASYKHPKEQKIQSIYKDQKGKDFIYDKKNYMYCLSLTAGLSRILLPPSDHNRISIRATAALGPTLALLKPYYVEVAVPINPTQAIVNEVPYDASQYSYFDIVGQGGYFLGMSEVKAVFGVGWKIGGIVDFSRSTSYIRGVELLFFGDVFIKRPEVMDQTKNKLLFIGGSMGFVIGNGW